MYIYIYREYTYKGNRKVVHRDVAKLCPFKFAWIQRWVFNMTFVFVVYCCLCLWAARRGARGGGRPPRGLGGEPPAPPWATAAAVGPGGGYVAQK